MLCKRKADPERKNSEEIDRYLKDEASKRKKIIEILLLGTGESGKTTIIKQMKILHLNGFTENERCEKIPKIKQNLHESIYDIVNNMDKIFPPITIRNEESRISAEYILNLGPNEPTNYTDEYFDHVKILWSDPDVKNTYNRSNEFQLIDSAAHFLDRIDMIREENYIPTIEDILYCRIKTVTISKIEFNVPVPVTYGGGNVTFWMYDVGGQRGEQKKWITVFEGIKAILFLIAASDFDQTLREDTQKNRLEEAFQVFENVCTSRFVRNAGLIVFLNKQDLLEKKIKQGKRIDKYFPEYENFKLVDNNNPNYEYDRARCFIKQKVVDIAAVPITIDRVPGIPSMNVSEELPPRTVYTHFTIATDTKNIKKVFDSVHDIILKTNMKEIFSF